MNRRLVRVLAMMACLALPFSTGALAFEVPPERLLGAAGEPENWLLPHGSYDAHRFSTLSEIDRENVGTAKVLYYVPIGGGSQGAGNFTALRPVNPLVEDGFVYVLDGWGKLNKIDLHRGVEDRDRVVWESAPVYEDVDSWLRASRGIALYRDFVIVPSADGRVHWIDGESGELVRSVSVGDPATGYTIAAAPLVVGDRLLIGSGGRSRATRGQLAALDAATGDVLWRTYTIPAPGDPGSDTWQGWTDGWMVGGGSFEQVGSYDAEAGLTIWSTEGPQPRFDPDARPGDNLFTNSLLAFDVASGEMRWYYQHSPGGPLGFSGAGTGLIVPSLGAVASFASNGFAYVLDSATGAIRSATPYVPALGWTAGIDLQTGKPVEYDPALAIQSYRPPDSPTPAGCPNILSTPAFAAAYSPATGLAYGAADGGCDLVSTLPVRTDRYSGWLGAYYVDAANEIGSMAAVDLATGDLTAQTLLRAPLHAGAVATAGGLVWTTTADGTLYALDDRTLETLWSQEFTTLSPAPPITFAVDGKQIVAVLLGGNPFVSRLAYQPRVITDLQALLVLALVGL